MAQPPRPAQALFNAGVRAEHGGTLHRQRNIPYRLVAGHPTPRVAVARPLEHLACNRRNVYTPLLQSAERHVPHGNACCGVGIGGTGGGTLGKHRVAGGDMAGATPPEHGALYRYGLDIAVGAARFPGSASLVCYRIAPFRRGALYHWGDYLRTEEARPLPPGVRLPRDIPPVRDSGECGLHNCDLGMGA